MRPPLKLAYYSSSSLPSRAANSIHVMKMCAALAAEGAEVRLFGLCGTEPAPGSTGLYDFYAVPPAFRVTRFADLPVRGWRRCTAWLAAWRGRAWGARIHYGRCLRSVYNAARLGQPVAYEAHQPCSSPRSVQHRLFLELFRRNDRFRLVVITEKLRDRFCNDFDLTPDRVLVLCDGADLPDPPPPLWQRSPASRLRVGYVGQLYPGKGIQMIARLARALPQYDFEVVGGGETDLSHWRRELAPVSNLVLHGFVPFCATESFRRCCDVLIAPYQYKIAMSSGGDIGGWTSPLKLFEYMGSRKPIVCSNLPVLHEVMRHGENSLLCDPEDVPAWVAALRRIECEEGLAHRLAENAYQGLKHQYTWRRRAQRLLAALSGAGWARTAARPPAGATVPSPTPVVTGRENAA